jgi:nucleoside phosphorylase/tripartite-type tricarboxylate transporter receptor subunit TctC
MPAYHLVREDRAGITMVNIGVGPANAKTITDHIAVLRPHAWMMLGHCAGLRNSQQLGDYVLAHAYVREDHVLDEELPLWVPIPALAEIQLALEKAVADVTRCRARPEDHHAHRHRGQHRQPQLGAAAQNEPQRRFSQSRAVALDMESATIAANGFRFRVPYGTLLCVSDKPLHGEIKLPGMANHFYRERVEQHLRIGMRAIEILRATRLRPGCTAASCAASRTSFGGSHDNRKKDDPVAFRSPVFSRPARLFVSLLSLLSLFPSLLSHPVPPRLLRMDHGPAVTMAHMAPVARLTSDYEVVAVKADSPIKTPKDLIAQLRADAGGTVIAGGSAGGVDHMYAGMLARVAEASQTLAYQAHPGGAEVVEALDSGKAAAGISGYSEFAESLASGKLRAIGVSSKRPFQGIASVREQGVDADLANWRGVLTGRKVPPYRRTALLTVVRRATATDVWQKTVKSNNWDAFWAEGKDFENFLELDTAMAGPLIYLLKLKA